MKVVTLPTTRIRNLVMIEKDRDGFEGSCIPGALCKGFFDPWWQIGADRIHGDGIQCRTAERVQESQAVSAILIHGRFPRPPVLAVKRAVTKAESRGNVWIVMLFFPFPSGKYEDKSLNLQKGKYRENTFGLSLYRIQWREKLELCTSSNVHSMWAFPTIDSASVDSSPIQHCRQHVEKTLLFAECS